MDPYLQELAKAGISSATKVLLEKTLTFLSDKKFNKGKELIEELLVDDNYTNFLTKHVSRTIKIRTIHSSEKDVYLNEIYHALSIRNMESNQTIKIKDGFFIENENLNNIIGFAGQGKSTILRKLFIEQLKHGEKIPFFIELNKAEKSGVLKQLELILIECGIKTTEEKLENLLSSGKIILLLDGFDEISPSNRRPMIDEIISIHRKNNVQIITTTRPETEICHEANISNYKVEKLKRADILAIIKKLNSSTNYFNDDITSKISGILSENQRLIGVMNLPILVTLFYICYPLLDKMPRNAVDFYENLFATLYLRHDKVKNLERHKSSDVSYAKAYEAFCALSFMSLYDNQGSFNELSLYNFVERSMDVSSISKEKNPPEKLVSDFINVTCLIQKDGYDRFVYLHKSVQEYHAAEFIKNMSIDKKEKLYKRMIIETIENNRFSNVISFLSSIDEDNFISNLTLPLCEELGIDKWDSPSDEKALALIMEISDFSSIELVRFKERDNVTSLGISLSSNKYSWLATFTSSDRVRSNESVIDTLLNNVLIKTNGIDPDILDSKSIPYGHSEENKGFSHEGKQTIPTNDVLKALSLYDELIEPVKKAMQETFDNLYKRNKNKLETKNKNLETYFDFL